jgi:hypothetical protein
VGTAQALHTQHYVDSTNLWNETAYPMGTNNPGCQSYWVYDRYLDFAPADNSTVEYSTYQTNHSWLRGDAANRWLGAIPTRLGYNTASLLDHNTVVGRSTGRCTGRYVFQWTNHTSAGYSNFLSDPYWVAAWIPPNLIPSADSTACKERDVASVPHIFIDLYACEAPAGTNIGSFTAWCGLNSGKWRKAGSSSGLGYYNSFWERCDVTAGLYYAPPTGKVGVALNMVIKAGIGHGVAPAVISISRY